MIHFYLFLITCFLQLDNNCILWERNVLRKSNFKLVSEEFEGYDRRAMTYAKISIKTTKKGGKVVFIVCNRFLKDRSWKKSDFDEYVLNHEQRHFDIAEIYARKIRYSLDSIKSEPLKYYKSIVQNHLRARKKYSEKYDDETNHSQNKEVQELWNNYIDKELLRYEEYALEDNCKCKDF